MSDTKVQEIEIVNPQRYSSRLAMGKMMDKLLQKNQINMPQIREPKCHAVSSPNKSLYQTEKERKRQLEAKKQEDGLRTNQ